VPTPSGPPTIASDKDDYPAGATVILTGTNWQPGEPVRINVNDTIGQTWKRDVTVTADSSGNVRDVFTLPTYFVSDYDVVATGASSGVATTTFTDAPPDLQNLWQCDPPTGYTPSTYTCATAGASGWVTGNNDGPFLEGETVPYRTRMQNLAVGNKYSVTIQWDTTKSSKHALDYLRSFNATITNANPCLSLTGLPAGLCSGSPSTVAIPQDTFMQSDANWIANAGVQNSGVFTMFGGSLTATSAYVTPSSYTGDTSTSITVFFTANSTDVVLAWGGHIASRDDWGSGNSAVSISGSPYHMRILSWFDVTNNTGLNAGNTDRSLSAEAVIYPGSITIIKQANPEGSTSFPFTASPSPLSNFNLVDDGTSANTKVFSNITTFTTYNVAESAPSGWNLDSISCSVSSANGGTQTVTSPGVNINLKEGEDVTCTFNNTQLVQKKDLTVSKTAAASLTRTYKWGITKNVDKTSANIAEGDSATFNYTVSVTHDSGTDSAWKVTGNITVNNPNAFSVSGVSVSDSIDPNATCVVSGGSTTIAANSSAVYNYTCTYSQAPAAASQTNTATATWTAFGSPSTSASGTAAVNWANATMTLKDGSVSVTDTLGGSLGTVLYTDPSPKTFTYSKTFGGVAGTCKTYDNTATFTTNDTNTTGSASKTVTVCVGKDLTVSKTATASLNRTYKWLIDKSVDDTRIEIAEGGTATFNYTVAVTPNGYTDDGYTLGGTITVNNPNDWQAITLTSVTDTLDQNGTCDITEVAPYVVPKSGSLVLHYTCTTGGTSTKNTATVTWDKTAYVTPTGTASGDATVSFTTATETNKTITVVDDKTDPQHPVTLGTWNWADGAHAFTYSLEKQGVAGECADYTNTATISETGQKASQKVTVCVGKDLTVTKTATASLNRTYKWLIGKSVDDTRIEIAEGGTATFNYTVAVTPNGYTDSDHTLGGTITVNNPNKWQDVTVSVADTLDQGGTCAITESAPYVVPKNGSLTLHYTCATDGTSTKNTATATWNKATYVTPTGSASGDATVSFTTANETNKTITVVDDKTTSTPVTLGTSDYFTGPFEFNYALEKQGVAGECTDYTNTAKISETGQTDSQKVTVCVGKDLTVSKTAESSFTRTYKWSIEKSVDDTQINIADGDTATFNYTVKVSHDAGTDSALTVVGKITVTNPNDWENIVVDVTDALDTGACSVTGGTGVTIPAGKSVVLDYTCASADPAATKNTATATWNKATYSTPNGTASGSANVAFATPSTIVDGSVTVVDDKTNPSSPVALGTLSYTDPSPKLFTYSVSKNGVAGTCTDYTNTATFTTNTTGTEGSDSQTVTVCVGADLTVSKTAAGTFNREYLWSIEKSADKTEVKIADGSSYTFHYTVDVAQTGVTDSGWTLSGKITVTNPNDWQAITLTGLTDVIDNGGTCTVAAGPYIVPKSGSIDVNYTCSYGSAPSSYSGTNTATASWDKAAAFTPSGTASGSADFTLTQLGSINKTIEVVDTYAGTLGTVTATDTTPFTTRSFTYNRTEKGVAGTCTNYDNTATIVETEQSASEQVKLCVAKDLTVSKTAAGTFDRTYTWSMKKSADKTEVSIADGSSYTFHYTVDVAQTGVTDSGWALSGKITVTNPNDWQAITLTGLTDVIDNGGTCTVAAGPYIVPKSGSIDVNYTCSYGSAPSSYSGTNTATASWDKAAAFTPNGTASGSADFALTQAGSTNKTINVTDSYARALGTVTATDTTPFASKSFTYDRTEKGVAGTCTTYNNTATITETKQSASQSVRLCVAKDLTVSKTAIPAFARTYLWNISKAVDKTAVTQVSGSAVFNYTVIVNQTGITDSGWKVTGKITVTNPNDWESIVANVTDALDTGACSVVGGTGVTIPAGKSVVLDYTCDPANSAATRNTATATWDKAAAFTPSGTASGTASVAFVTPTSTTNKTVTVTDTFNGTTTTLGTVTATDGTPYASKTFTYSRSITVTFGCKSYDNTAKIVETGQTASQTVKVCGPIQTGAKTIGFWQNKNGQGIITGQAKSGVCPSASWLRQYAPFQDLSATATCAQVGTYVTNIIKAANASGAAMNAMLKAQMLATALDVYFSDPALGGNKIGAPKPIGSVTIDLTKICKITDSSGGATCGGTTANASTAFGGATSLTVLQILAYAASQSNAGGSTWYAQNKSIQELAKNTFDAINNEWAFAP
jgi:Fe-S cluster assembly iron-binding protein IscA